MVVNNRTPPGYSVRVIRVVRLLYFIVLTGFVMAWVLSYIVPASTVAAINGVIFELASKRGHLWVRNTPTIQTEQHLAALRAKEMDQLDSLFWNDFEPRWEAVHFNGTLSGPMPANLREERSGVLLEEAAITKRQRHLRASPIHVGVLRSYNLPYWGATLAAMFPLFASLILREMRNRVAARRLLPLCKVCGYDLRATPYRCPECGSLPRRESVDEKEHAGEQNGRVTYTVTYTD